MATYTDPTQLSGLFKEVYGDDVINLVPECAKIIKKVPFVTESKQEGNKYHQPVILTYEQGMTYAAADAGAFALNASVAMTMGDAQVQGSQMLLRSALSYDAAARAATGKRAFQKATELIVENMLESITKRLELSYLYGGQNTGFGTPAASTTSVDATHTKFTILLATWAAGIWAGLEGAQIDVLDNGVVINTNGAVTIDSVDLSTRVVTVSAAAADITLLDAVTYTTDDGIIFRGALSSEMSGIDKAITNTGTLWNLSAATYNLWKGNSYGVGSAALSFGKVLAGLVQANHKGLMEDVTLYVNPKTWVDLADDLAAIRVTDSSYKTKNVDQGSEDLTYWYMGGKITVEAHLFVKEGEAFAIPLKRMKRLGAQDVSFKTPGRGDEIFQHLADRAGYELRCYTDQAAFIERIAFCTKYTGIVNAT